MDVRAKRDGQDLYDFGTFTLDASDRRLTRAPTADAATSEGSAGVVRRAQL